MMTWIVISWVLLLSVTMAVTMRYALRTFQDKIDEILVATVESLRSTPTVRDMLRTGVCPPEMDEYLDAVIEYTSDLDYITIADTDSIRVYHVDPDKIGKTFEGGDQYRALEGECYMTDTKPGDRDVARRAFGPIYDEDGNIIGFVMAAARHIRIDELRNEIYETYFQLGILLMLCTLIFGGALALYLGRNLRGVKPDDLLRMLFPYGTMRAAKPLDRQCTDLLQRRLHGSSVLSYDARIIPEHLASVHLECIRLAVAESLRTIVGTFTVLCNFLTVTAFVVYAVFFDRYSVMTDASLVACTFIPAERVFRVLDSMFQCSECAECVSRK